MKVQLDDKSKAEFIEHIAKDSITCWFDGDEFVMPSGQGRTARGIVLGKLIAWQHQQSKVDALTLQVAEMKSRLNDAYTNGQSAMYTARQSKIDELQKRVDAVKGLAQTLWEKSEEKHQQGKVWESKTLGECADEILDVLEQALKGGSND